MTDEEIPEGRWARSTTRQRVVVGTAAVAGLALVAWLAFGIFGVHTLFVDDKVDEANPFATTETTAAPADTTPATTDDATVATTEAPVPEAAVTTTATGQFVDRSHPTSGTASVITDGDRTFLRFEDFQTDNGPDLNVYLSTADPQGSPDDFIDLGTLKGNIGDQNYELDADVDISEYSSVFVLCVRFSVAFGAAPLG